MNPSDVSDRVGELKAEKQEIEAELAERMSIKELPASISSPENIKRIQEDLHATLHACSPQTLKAYLKILVEDIEVDGERVTIRAKSAGVMAFLDRNEKLRTEGVTPVLNRVNKWRPICKAVKYCVGTFDLPCNTLPDNVLRFSGPQVALWLRELMDQKGKKSQAQVAQFVGVSRKVVWRYLKSAA